MTTEYAGAAVKLHASRAWHGPGYLSNGTYFWYSLGTWLR